MSAIESPESSQRTIIDNCPNEYQEMKSSRISLKSTEDINLLCTSNLHRSHSLNCSTRSYEMDDTTHILNFLSPGRKSVANHHRHINYHFRPAVYNGQASTKIHCSSLVLTSESTSNLKFISQAATKHSKSKSLPNLEVSFECNKSKTTSSLKNLDTDIQVQLEFSNLSNESENTPVIYNEHIIRIDV